MDGEMGDMIVRTLTIVVQFDSKNPPEWIWDCHKNNSLQCGVLVKAIADGDLTRPCNEED